MSNAPFTFNSGASAFPDQPITLCSAHALDAFGVAFDARPIPPAEQED